MLFVRVLTWYPLKPMQIQANCQTRSIKPIEKQQQEYSQEYSQEHSQQYSQEGLAMDSLYLNAVCMGFMSLANCDAAIGMGFKVVPP